jgi:hypothetical protein
LRFFAAKNLLDLHDSSLLAAQKSGVDHREIREIRENRVAFVRVFRVVRGENASLL